MEKSRVNGKSFISISPHPTKFWTGEIVQGSHELATLTTLMDESETILSTDGFEIIRFKKSLTLVGEEVLSSMILDDTVDYILVPAMFSSVDLSSLPRREKMVAFNATQKTLRLSPSEKVASSRLTLIW